MLVEQIAVNNNLRNYMYLIACSETREAVAIDPLDHESALKRAQELGWTIRGVINTHEHQDHIGGNEPVIAATGATLYAHHQAGHTFCHTCLYYIGDESEPPALFCGDTLFNAGVGNCHNGGNPQTMYQTFAEQIFVLPDSTKIYPGHDYIVNNLQFTLDREPGNAAAQSLLVALEQWPGEKHFISNIAMEKLVNTFFRLKSEELIELLRQRFPDLGEQPSEESVFLKLRELRNSW